MKSEITKSFRDSFRLLPEQVRRTARKNYRLWLQNPRHPSLEYKLVIPSRNIYSVRVGIDWRALGVKKSDDTLVWFWIGSHSEYDTILNKS